MASEADIIQRESGGHPFVGYGGVDLSQAPRNQYGFPIWEGRMGPAGISHAAGLYQFEPKTWAEGAAALGIKDFSPQSQKQVYDYTRAKYGDAPWAASAPGGTAAAALGRKRLGGDAFASSYESSQGGLKSGLQLLNFLSQQNQQTQAEDQKPSSGAALLQTLMAETKEPEQKPEAKQPAEQPPSPSPYTPPPENVLEPVQFKDVPPPSTPQAPQFGQQQPQQAPAQPSSGRQLLQQLTQQSPEMPIPTGEGMLPPMIPNLPAPNLAGALDMQPVGEQILESAQREQQARQSGKGLLAQIMASAESPFAGSIAPGVIGGITRRVPPRIEPPALRTEPGGGRPAQPSAQSGVPAAQAPPPAAGPAAAITAPQLVPGGAGRIEPTQMPLAPLPSDPRFQAAMGGGRGGALPPEPPEPPTLSPRQVRRGAVKLASELDDDLHRASQAGQADMIEVRQLVEGLPKELLDPKVQERAYTERESRMTGKPLPISETTRQTEAALTQLDKAAHDDAQWIQRNAPDVAKDLKDFPTAEQGYVHRKAIGKNPPGERLDPAAGDIITGAGGRSLSRVASGAQHRTPYYVLEDNAGNRVFQRKSSLRDADPGIPAPGPPVTLGQFKNSPTRYGETITDYRTGKRYTVKPPTTAEIEANTNIRYQKNLLANTVDNTLRLRRVRRNLELLNEWKPKLTESGHFVADGTQKNAPAHFVHVDLPQFKGMAEPHIADVLNDFYRASRDDIEGFLAKANHFLIGSMFALPVRHIENVGAHYVVGRGFDWLYSNPMLAQATREVASQGPRYLQYLKAGAGLRYPSTLNENFYGTMLEKMFNDQTNLPWWKEVAEGVFKGDPKLAGMGVADMVKAEYAWSRKNLWKVNDIFLTARIMEFERRGYPMEKAIQLAEKEIPNYRIPVEVMRSRRIAQLLKSPYVAFGRYAYGRGKAITEMIKDMVGPQATGEERLRAIGQATVLAGLGLGLWSTFSAGVNMAMQKMGLRDEGDRKMEVSGWGPIGIVRDIASQSAIVRDTAAKFGLTLEQATIAEMISDLIIPSPLSSIISESVTGGDPYTGQPLVDLNYASPQGIAAQSIEAATKPFYPLQLGLDALRRGPVAALGPSVFGVRQERYQPTGKVEKIKRRQAKKREERDPLTQLIAPLFQ